MLNILIYHTCYSHHQTKSKSYDLIINPQIMLMFQINTFTFLFLLLLSSTKVHSSLSSSELAESLHTFIRKGDFKAFIKIVESNQVDDSQIDEIVNHVDNNGRTPLHHVARWASLEMFTGERASMATKLIHAGAKLDVVDNSGKTPLHLSAANGYLEGSGLSITSQLLEAGCNKNIQDDQGYTPLIHAVSKGFKHIAALLIESGANIHLLENENQYDAFMIASRKGHLKIVSTLLDHHDNIDVMRTCNQGNTAIDLAEFAGHVEVANLIRKYGGIEMPKEL